MTKINTCIKFIFGFIIILAITSIAYYIYYIINQNNSIQNMKTLLQNVANADGCKNASNYAKCIINDMVNNYGYYTSNNIIINNNQNNSDAVKHMSNITTSCSQQYCK